MTTVQIYGRSRFKFAKLFPMAIFEGYECNIKFAYFTIKTKISGTKIKGICETEKITIIDITTKWKHRKDKATSSNRNPIKQFSSTL